MRGKERNVCVSEHSCNASCCRGAEINFRGDTGWEQYRDLVNEFGGEIKRVRPEDRPLLSLLIKKDSDDPVVYHTPLMVEDVGAIHLVLVDGACPVLDEETNNCRAYDRRPDACKKVDIGGDTCSKQRLSSGLVPIEIVG